ncbi:protocatechuate 3,4-dioxygenase subunit alpha [soil metagenome]
MTTTTTLLKQTPSQTVGPFFAYGLTAEQYGYGYTSAYMPVLAEPRAKGEAIELVGQVFDGKGVPIADAVIEISQLDSTGQAITTRQQAEETGFTGFGRCGTGFDKHQRFHFRTVKPGAEAADEAPVINVIVLMRGLLVHAFTRVYFDDESAANSKDKVLKSVPEERRPTLVAKREELPGGVRYTFDIHMQGPQETVFFDL